MEKSFTYEEELYNPVAEYLLGLGFEVRAEVNHCDICAIKDNQLLIVELKKILSIELLIQATKRQKLADLVYVAIPRPKSYRQNKKWNGTLQLLRRLELGLIFVSKTTKNNKVDVIIDLSPLI